LCADCHSLLYQVGNPLDRTAGKTPDLYLPLKFVKIT
jgi:hypothetical protein